MQHKLFETYEAWDLTLPPIPERSIFCSLEPINVGTPSGGKSDGLHLRAWLQRMQSFLWRSHEQGGGAACPGQVSTVSPHITQGRKPTY